MEYKKYYPVPPIMPLGYQYQNINHDLTLRKNVTDFFHTKIIKWITNYSEFSNYKNKLDYLNTVDGKIHLYNVLRKFVKRSNINWYDLRDNYDIVKSYLQKKLF